MSECSQSPSSEALDAARAWLKYRWPYGRFDDSIGASLGEMLDDYRRGNQAAVGARDLAARLETALGLLREAHGMWPKEPHLPKRTEAFLATIDADTDSAGRRGG